MLLAQEEQSPTERVQATYTEIQAQIARNDYRRFLRDAWTVFEPSPFVPNWHLDAICDHLVYVSLGDIRNLMINVPPRSTKSLGASVGWPVWDWLDTPERQFLCSSYAHDLAMRDAGKSRDLIQSAWFQERYGDRFYIDPGRNQRKHYWNNHNGYRMSISVGGKTTGEGGDILMGDDFHNMADVHSDPKREGVLNWHDNAWRSRMNNAKTAQKVYIGQRSHDADVYGHVLETERDRWVVLELPAEFVKARRCVTYFNRRGKEPEKDKGKIFEDPRTEEGEMLNPERFGEEEADAERRAMSTADYSAQYQQDPSSGGGLILKKQWWQQWVYPPDHPQAYQEMPMPDFDMVISVYDTAFEEEQENDPSARTSWGLFEMDDRTHIMLLERFNERIAFPDLKKEASDHHTIWRPDWTLIEKKSSGHSLIQELRASGIHVTAVLKDRDKVYCAHMVQQVLRDGLVWYVPRRWAYEVITQCAKFPRVRHDDMVDTCLMAWAFLRRMSLIDLPSDEKPGEMKLFEARKFYGAA